MMDDLSVQGIRAVTFHITVSLTTMLAMANFAIDSRCHESMRSIVRNLAA